MFNIILLIVYLLGIAATIIVMYRSLGEGQDVTLGEIILGLILLIFSWISFIFFCIMVYGDVVIFTKK